MRQMVPNMASVTGLTGKTFHPFVCLRSMRAEITSLEAHSLQTPLVNYIVKVAVGLSSFDGLFCGALVNRLYLYMAVKWLTLVL